MPTKELQEVTEARSPHEEGEERRGAQHGQLPPAEWRLTRATLSHGPKRATADRSLAGLPPCALGCAAGGGGGAPTASHLRLSDVASGPQRLGGHVPATMPIGLKDGEVSPMDIVRGDARVGCEAMYDAETQTLISAPWNAAVVVEISQELVVYRHSGGPLPQPGIAAPCDGPACRS